jgi:HSP20 family protein
MALAPWQPFRELSAIRHQMDRLFEELLPRERDWLGLPGNGGMWTPAIEMEETNQELILKAEIPGVEAKDLDVEVTQDEVSISGEHQEEKRTEDKNFFRSEFHYGKFQRTIALPVSIQTDKIKSQFKDGILTLTMPKAEDAVKKVVKVNLAN